MTRRMLAIVTFVYAFSMGAILSCWIRDDIGQLIVGFAMAGSFLIGVLATQVRRDA